MSYWGKVKRKLAAYRGIFLKCYRNIYNIFRFMAKKNQFGVYKGAKREEYMIVSLTSFPPRMNTLHLCLQSLLLQDMKPDKIIVWLSTDEFKGIDIPEKVLNLKKYGVEIRFCEDLKPHKKYFYCCQEYPDACVITVDDDICYNQNLVADLYNAHLKNPKEVICTRAHKMRMEGNILLPYNEWDYETQDTGQKSHLLMSTGVGGVLYPPHCLPAEAFDKEAIIKYCLNADDVWLKAMEILNGTKVFAFPFSKSKYGTGIWGTNKTSLSKSNVVGGDNDRYIRQTFDAYGITADFIRERDE